MSRRPFSPRKAYLLCVPGATEHQARRYAKEVERRTLPGVVSDLIHRQKADPAKLLAYVRS